MVAASVLHQGAAPSGDVLLPLPLVDEAGGEVRLLQRQQLLRFERSPVGFFAVSALSRRAPSTPIPRCSPGAITFCNVTPIAQRGLRRGAGG